MWRGVRHTDVEKLYVLWKGHQELVSVHILNASMATLFSMHAHSVVACGTIDVHEKRICHSNGPGK